MRFTIHPELPASDVRRARGVIFEDYDLGDGFRTVDGVLTSPDGERTA
jgi:hypothetical protein